MGTDRVLNEAELAHLQALVNVYMHGGLARFSPDWNEMMHLAQSRIVELQNDFDGGILSPRSDKSAWRALKILEILFNHERASAIKAYEVQVALETFAKAEKLLRLTFKEFNAGCIYFLDHIGLNDYLRDHKTLKPNQFVVDLISRESIAGVEVKPHDSNYRSYKPTPMAAFDMAENVMRVTEYHKWVVQDETYEYDTSSAETYYVLNKGQLACSDEPPEHSTIEVVRRADVTERVEYEATDRYIRYRIVS